MDSQKKLYGFQFCFKKRAAHYLALIIALILISACQPAIPAAPTTAEPEETAITESAPTVQVLPTAAPQTILSDQPYASPSGAFEIYLPKDWNCSETGQYRVDCQPQSGSANVTLRATATGYELKQDAFEALITAETVNTYSDKKAYTETSRETGEGLVAINATWRESDTQWQSKDVFTRSGAGAYQLSLTAVQAQSDEFAPLFEQIIEKTTYLPEALSGAPIYAQIRKYFAPDLVFTLEVPTAWSKYADFGRIENTQIEGFLSPDKHAAVQIATYRQGSFVTQQAKAIKTLDVMRLLYGYDLRISDDKALPEGRERLAWSAGRREISGISYFDSYGSSIYIFSVVWDDAFQGMYEDILNTIDESFGYD